MTEKKGLVIVFTGEGKGKTTAALGTALRAVGHRMNVLVLQFIKGSWRSGELDAAKMLAPKLQIETVGGGFVEPSGGRPKTEDVRLAEAGLERCRKAFASGEYNVIVLDEVIYAVKYGLLKVGDVLGIIREKPKSLHLVLTGRDAPKEIIDAADLVTEMREIKHPFRNGEKAVKGIDF
jgi:cob(I)alamin adenosyltransferase